MINKRIGITQIKGNRIMQIIANICTTCALRFETEVYDLVSLFNESENV